MAKRYMQVGDPYSVPIRVLRSPVAGHDNAYRLVTIDELIDGHASERSIKALFRDFEAAKDFRYTPLMFRHRSTLRDEPWIVSTWSMVEAMPNTYFKGCFHNAGWAHHFGWHLENEVWVPPC